MCLALGAACESGGEPACGGNNYCNINTVCTAPTEAGACALQYPFPDAACYSEILGELQCVNGGCQVMLNTELPNDVCGTEACITKTTCDTTLGRCAGVAPGGGCDFSDQCTFGYYCANIVGADSGECTARIPLGGACSGKGVPGELSVCESDLTASCGPAGVCIAKLSVASGGLCNDGSQCVPDTYCRFANDSSRGRCTPAPTAPVPCTLDGNECELAGADTSDCVCNSAGALVCNGMQPYIMTPCTAQEYNNYADCMNRNQCQADEDDANDLRSCAMQYCKVELNCLQYCLVTLPNLDNIALGCSINDPRFVCLPDDNAVALGMMLPVIFFLLFVAL